MSAKPFDPFRYSVETVSPVMRKDLARMTAPELGAEELEPPSALKQHLGSLASAASSPAAGPSPAPAPQAPLAGPAPSKPPRRVSKAVLLALGFALGSLALALLRA